MSEFHDLPTKLAEADKLAKQCLFLQESLATTHSRKSAITKAKEVVVNRLNGPKTDPGKEQLEHNLRRLEFNMNDIEFLMHSITHQINMISGASASLQSDIMDTNGRCQVQQTEHKTRGASLLADVRALKHSPSVTFLRSSAEQTILFQHSKLCEELSSIVDSFDNRLDVNVALASAFGSLWRQAGRSVAASEIVLLWTGLFLAECPRPRTPMQFFLVSAVSPSPSLSNCASSMRGYVLLGP